MCELVPVSRASFYRHWENAAPDEAEQALRDAIQKAALSHHRHCGYRVIQAELRNIGMVVGEDKLRRLLREDNLLAVRKRKFVRTSDSGHGFRVYPNLAQYLELTDINQLWVADLTYIRLKGEFVYMAVVLDGWSRKVIGWALGKSLDHQLPLEALERAIASRQPRPGLVHHSDRGSQYACDNYVQPLEKIQAVLSMSAPASPWENGKCERFLRTLKEEEIDARPYADMEELREHVEEFLEQVYNKSRLHSALRYQCPEQFEANCRPWSAAGMRLPRHEEVIEHGMR
jgi:transposase InsO family protein